MFYWLIPLIIGIIFLGLFLFFRVKEKRVIAVVFKGCTSLMFIVTALVAWLTSKNPNSSFGIFVLLGLFFGLLGDIFLDLKFILKRELLWTTFGFFAFAFGHVFYLTGLFINFYDFNNNILYLVLPGVIAFLLVVVTLLMEKFTPIRYGKMKPCCIGYGFLLFFTTSTYFSTTIQSGWNVVTLIIMSICLILFMFSDLILNNTYFAKGYTAPVYIISNHVLYYIAQFGIAISLFFLL